MWWSKLQGAVQQQDGARWAGWARRGLLTRGEGVVNVVRVPHAVQTWVGGAGCRSDVSLAFESWVC